MAFVSPLVASPLLTSSSFRCRRPFKFRCAPARRRPAYRPSMALMAGYGINDQESDELCVEWMVRDALEHLGETKPELAILHMTANRDIGLVYRLVREALGGDVQIMGATTNSGVLIPQGTVLDGVSLLLLGGDTDAFSTSSASFQSDAEAASHAAAVTLRERLGTDAAAVCVMSTPGHEEAILRGIEKVFGSDVQIFGGSAADNDISGKWAVYEGENGVITSGLAMFAVKKDSGVRVGAHLSSPYVATDTMSEVTTSQGRTLVSLDGRPAADVLYAQVGDALKEQHSAGGTTLAPMSTRPYALRRNGAGDIAVHVSSINQPDGTVSLFVEPRAGDKLVRMENVEKLEPVFAVGEGIRESYSNALRRAGIKDGSPVAAMMVYCGGLSMAVGEGVERNCVIDLQCLEGIPPLATVGFTAFGEQGPSGEEGRNQHRNLSVGMLVLQ